MKAAQMTDGMVVGSVVEGILGVGETGGSVLRGRRQRADAGREMANGRWKRVAGGGDVESGRRRTGVGALDVGNGGEGVSGGVWSVREGGRSATEGVQSIPSRSRNVPDGVFHTEKLMWNDLCISFDVENHAQGRAESVRPASRHPARAKQSFARKGIPKLELGNEGRGRRRGCVHVFCECSVSKPNS